MTNIRNNTSTDALGEFLRKNQELFKPLTKAQEQSLILENRNDPAKMQRLLVMHNIRIVFNLARKYAPTSMDFDEMIGRGLEGLCIAAKKFDPKRNIKFITYATPWVFKYIMKEYSDDDVETSRMGIPLNRPILDSDGTKTTFENLVNSYLDQSTYHSENILSAEKSVEGLEKSDIYSKLVSYVKTNENFDEMDRIIFQRNLIDKDSMKQISADLNIQHNQASRKKKKLLEKLRSVLEKKYSIRSLEDI